VAIRLRIPVAAAVGHHLVSRLLQHPAFLFKYGVFSPRPLIGVVHQYDLHKILVQATAPAFLSQAWLLENCAHNLRR